MPDANAPSPVDLGLDMNMVVDMDVDVDLDVDMELDPNPSTTLVTVTRNPPNTPGRTSDVPSVQTPGGVRLPRTEAEEHSDSAPVQSPSFSGFHSHSHSARSSPGAIISIRLNGPEAEAEEESHLEGHTLIDEQQSMLGHTLIGEPSLLVDSNQDGSALSFASASINQSHIPPSRQIINDSLLTPRQFGGESSQDSLLVSLHATESGNEHEPTDSGVALGEVANEVEVELRPTPTLGDGPDNEDEPLPDFNFRFTPDENRLMHSESSLHLSRSPSPSHSHSPSANPPTSAQQDPESNSSPDSIPAKTHSPIPNSSTPPAGSTRSRKRSSQFASQSQPLQSQVFDYIDLTQTPPPVLSPRDTSTPRLATEPVESSNNTESPYRPRRTRASSKAQLSQSPSKIPKRKRKTTKEKEKRVVKKVSPKKPEWRF